MARDDTIFALSSGSPPAAVAVIRISGPRAGMTLRSFAGRMPLPRTATLASLRDPVGRQVLDNALILHFPAPASATGEEVAELHLHGGRAIVAAILGALGNMEGLRAADAGEFTRRAFENGRIDLTAAEGLADLLAAETESQRRAAIVLAGGALARQIDAWQAQLLSIAAKVEAALDFGDEADVAAHSDDWSGELNSLARDIESALARPPAERLRDGIRLVIAGPPNAGKSTLLNALAGREAAITSEVEGTTRDVVEAPTAIDGIPFLLADTAGFRLASDRVEAIGVERARAQLVQADIILWLGERGQCPTTVSPPIIVRSKADLVGAPVFDADIVISPLTNHGMDRLHNLLAERARALLPRESEIALNARQRDGIAEVLRALTDARTASDLLIFAEQLRLSRLGFDRITGRSGVEEMLDSLFGQFCIGK